jgi:hypothetical protein
MNCKTRRGLLVEALTPRPVHASSCEGPWHSSFAYSCSAADSAVHGKWARAGAMIGTEHRRAASADQVVGGRRSRRSLRLHNRRPRIAGITDAAMAMIVRPR